MFILLWISFLYSNSKFEINYDDYATEEEAYEAQQKMYEALNKDFEEKKSQLIYSNSKVNSAHNEIENHLKTIKGLKSYSVNNDPKSFIVEFNYIYISNYKSLGNFGKSFNQYYTNVEDKVKNTITKYEGYSLSFGGCGDYNDDPPILLTEELCNKYNLNCARW